MSNISQRLTSWAESSVLLWSKKGRPGEVEGERLLEAGDYVEAERCLAMAAEEGDRKRDSPAKRIRVRLHLAEAQRGQDKLADAEQNARAALEHAVKTNDAGVQILCLNLLGEVLMERGSFAAASKVFEETIRIVSGTKHPDASLLARTARHLGISRHKDGRTEEAIAKLEKAVTLYEQAFGAECLETGNLLAELGAICRTTHKYPEAQNWLLRALRIHERTSGRQSPEVLQDLRELVETAAESEDAGNAIAYCERILKLKDQSIGGDLGEMAETQLGIAKRYLEWGNNDRAHELLIQAIGVLKRTRGPSMAVGLEALAQVKIRAGQRESALAHLKQAAEIWASCGNERAEDLARTADQLTALNQRLRTDDQPVDSISREETNA